MWVFKVSTGRTLTILIYETENVKTQRPAMKSNIHASHSLLFFVTSWAFQKEHAQDKVYVAIFTSGEALVKICKIILLLL